MVQTYCFTLDSMSDSGEDCSSQGSHGIFISLFLKEQGLFVEPFRPQCEYSTNSVLFYQLYASSEEEKGRVTHVL